MARPQPSLPWLAPGEPFPDVRATWGEGSPAPGLLAAGGALDPQTLVDAYRQGIFPWFSVGQPILWWSPDPRMVLPVAGFRLHRSLRKTLAAFQRDPACEIRFDHDFAAVTAACAATPRRGQTGTWIVPEMQAAYLALHRAGHAHCVETWVNGERVGGLYCVNLGRAVFGESMFSHATDASKIALAALVAWCRASGVAQIDCQQNTGHLASLGAREVGRAAFVAQTARAVELLAPPWKFDPLYWEHLPGVTA